MSIFVTNLVNIGKKLESKLQYFDIYLHNKNILEYALLLVHSGRFMIFHIEGSSIAYIHIIYIWACPTFYTQVSSVC